MRRTAVIPALACALVSATASTAAAHVEVAPRSAAAGGLATFTIEVPNERTDAATVSVSVQIPDGVTLVRFAPVSGWRRTATREPLTQATTVGGDAVTERISSVTWSGGRIAPGEFMSFPISLAVPETPGAELRFPAVQRYEDGETVRWIGDEDADQPAAVVAIGEPADDGHGDGAAGDPAGDDHDGDTATTLALILGGAGLATGVAALLAPRMRRRT
jgi:uncharacterized protein YcnI